MLLIGLGFIVQLLKEDALCRKERGSEQEVKNDTTNYRKVSAIFTNDILQDISLFSNSRVMMNVVFVPHSKKAFYEVLEGVASKNFSLALLKNFTPFLCLIGALYLSVMNCTILQVFRGECH